MITEMQTAARWRLFAGAFPAMEKQPIVGIDCSAFQIVISVAYSTIFDPTPISPT
jgi:hypothetical protein